MKQYALRALAIGLAFVFTSASAAGASGTAPLPSLKEFYKDYFDFGSAVSSKEVQNPDNQVFFAAQYAIVTPENELKPASVLDEYNSQKVSDEDQGNVALHFNPAVPILNFARDNGLKVHGHVLFWHEQTPDTFFRESYLKSKPYVSRDVMLRRMENYVRITMEYMETSYPGLIVSWDVVNEAIDDSTGGMRDSNWTRIVGDDYVLQAFRFAQKYAPEGTLLYYNDYSTPYQPKLNGILELLDGLIAENLVDGYGFQCHYQLNTPTVSQYENAVQKIADKGLRLRVSEMDILVDGNTDAQFQKQAERYRELMDVLLRHAEQVEAVQTWGTRDSLSWKSGSYPLLFNGNLTPKPAFFALTNPDILP